MQVRNICGGFSVHIVLMAICIGCHCADIYAQGTHVRAIDWDGTSNADARDSVVRDLPLQGGGDQRVLFYGPNTVMRGIIVMFPGGADDIGIERDGTIRHGENFVVRSRKLWARRGYGVVIVDAIDHQSMRGQRSTSQYAAVTQEILAFAHSLSSVPVWVMGTSQGSIAAMNAAAHARPGELAGVVLTESVSILGKSHETVFDADPQDVRIPALVVANRGRHVSSRTAVDGERHRARHAQHPGHGSDRAGRDCAVVEWMQFAVPTRLLGHRREGRR